MKAFYRGSEGQITSKTGNITGSYIVITEKETEKETESPISKAINNLFDSIDTLDFINPVDDEEFSNTIEDVESLERKYFIC